MSCAAWRRPSIPFRSKVQVASETRTTSVRGRADDHQRGAAGCSQPAIEIGADECAVDVFDQDRLAGVLAHFIAHAITALGGMKALPRVGAGMPDMNHRCLRSSKRREEIGDPTYGFGIVAPSPPVRPHRRPFEHRSPRSIRLRATLGDFTRPNARSRLAIRQAEYEPRWPATIREGRRPGRGRQSPQGALGRSRWRRREDSSCAPSKPSTRPG